MINGDGAAPNLTGMFERLGNPAAPAAGVADFDDFVAAFGGRDRRACGASTIKDVAIVAGVDTYALSAHGFQRRGRAGSRQHGVRGLRHGNVWRMVDEQADAGQGERTFNRRFSTGRAARRWAPARRCGPRSPPIGAKFRWIDDIYSGSASGERYFTLHVLLGDVILVQPDAYAQVAFRVST